MCHSIRTANTLVMNYLGTENMLDVGQISSMLISEFNIAVPWGHIAVKAYGDPKASPVLCLHGKQDNADSFKPLLALLPPAFYYVAIDLPSHGLSSYMPPGKLLTVLDFSLAVDRVVDHFQWDQFQILGHSLGSTIGFVYTSLFPSKVSKLIVFDPIFELSSSDSSLFSFISNRHEKLLILEKGLASKTPPNYSKEEALRRIKENRRSYIPDSAAQILFSRGVKLNQEGYCFASDQRIKLTVPMLYTSKQMQELLSHIKCPLLVIRASVTHAFVDHQFDDFDIMFKSTLGQAYHHKLVEGVHDVHIAEPEKIADDVTRFLLLNKSLL